MRWSNYFSLLFLVLFFCGCMNDNFCNDDLKMFSVEHSTPSIKIEDGDTREQIISKLENKFKGDICYKDLSFGLQLSNKTVKTNLNLNCPIKTSRIPAQSELKILINQKGQALLNNYFQLDIDSIDLWVLNNLPLENENNLYKKEIAIIWNSLTPSKYFELAILEIMNGFSLKLDSIAINKTGRSYCRLTNEQRKTIRLAFPYKFILYLGPINPPPPPPSSNSLK